MWVYFLYRGFYQGVRGQSSLNQKRQDRNLALDSNKSQTLNWTQLLEGEDSTHGKTPRVEAQRH